MKQAILIFIAMIFVGCASGPMNSEETTLKRNLAHTNFVKTDKSNVHVIELLQRGRK